MATTRTTMSGGTKSAEDLTSILDFLRDEVRPVIASISGPRSCLQTCSVVGQVLRGCGYQAVTLGVVFQIFNDVCAQQVLDGLPIDVNAPGAWARQVGGGRNAGYADDGGWEGAGHVVVVVPEFGMLVDHSIDQVNTGHPEDPAPRDIVVQPFHSTPPRDQLRDMRWGRGQLTMINTGTNGRLYMLNYHGVPTDKSYLTAETFTDPHWGRLAQELVHKIRGGS